MAALTMERLEGASEPSSPQDPWVLEHYLLVEGDGRRVSSDLVAEELLFPSSDAQETHCGERLLAFLLYRAKHGISAGRPGGFGAVVDEAKLPCGARDLEQMLGQWKGKVMPPGVLASGELSWYLELHATALALDGKPLGTSFDANGSREDLARGIEAMGRAYEVSRAGPPASGLTESGVHFLFAVARIAGLARARSEAALALLAERWVERLLGDLLFWRADAPLADWDLVRYGHLLEYAYGPSYWHPSVVAARDVVLEEPLGAVGERLCSMIRSISDAVLQQDHWRHDYGFTSHTLVGFRGFVALNQGWRGPAAP